MVDGLPLCSLELFKPIAQVLANKSVWYRTGPGNTGDQLIHAGAACLFSKINTRMASSEERPDFLVWGGGGNLGGFWAASARERSAMFKLSAALFIPVIILPQSAPTPEEKFSSDVIVFAREGETQKIYPNSRLAPDTALAFDEDISAYRRRLPTHRLGVFLRRDKDSINGRLAHLSLADVARVSSHYRDYFGIAAQFETVATDRLHFAMAAIMLGRRAILLPNGYFKNRAVYDQWLQPLGCLWGPEKLLEMVAACDYRPDAIDGLYETARRSN